ILFHLLLKLLIKLAINLHSVDWDRILDLPFKGIGINVGIAGWARRWRGRFRKRSGRPERRKLDHFVVVEFLFEVFTIGKEIKEFEFFLLFVVLLNLTTFFLDNSKRVFSRSPTLHLDKLGRSKTMLSKSSQS